MIIKKMHKIIIFSIFVNLFVTISVFANDNFYLWMEDFKIKAINSGVSKKVVNEIMSDAKYLPKVLEYDRYQPEFYENTFTYIKKRTSKNKIKQGLKLYHSEKKIIEIIEKEFDVEKELLLALMGIETNFGKYLGKMDIVSSLSTLSFDKRRSEFFTKELIILLKLVDKKIIDRSILYGSWAGAFGNFQFMPRTIRNYAIDYNKNKTIELKKTEDSFASAANYLKTIGWKKNQPCYFKIDLENDIPKKYLNSSARNIKNKKKIFFFKKYIKNFDNLKINSNLLSAIIIPDKDIIPGAETLSPAYIVFENYEKILNWNRSLRFALAVCTLKNYFENEKDELNIPEYLVKVTKFSTPTRQAIEYSRIIYDMFVRRELIKISENTIDAAKLNALDVNGQNIIENSERLLFDLAEKGSFNSSLVKFDEAMKQTIEMASVAYKNDEGIVGVPTGLRDLDDRLGGLHNSDLLIIAGRPRTTSYNKQI